jgi:transposase
MTQTALRNESISNETDLYMAFELSNKEWKLGFGTGGNPRIRSIPARDLKALWEEVALAKEKLGLPSDAKVVSCYEAGRDGFWLHRHLVAEGAENRVVDSSSIEVNRRKRRAKTDRVDVRKLYRMLVRHERGEEGVWSVVRPPSQADEDERRIHRERERLQKECGGHNNRIRSLLILHGIDLGVSKHFLKDLERVRPLDGSELGPELKRELVREYERWELSLRQLRAVEKEASRRIRSAAEETKEALRNGETESRLAKAPKELSKPSQVAALMMLCGIGEYSAWPLVHEFFWRQFNNRREVGSAAGLCGMPYDSGDKAVEQGISKAGNGKIRRVMVELSWFWLRYQPESALTIWFKKRFEGGGKRMRRVGIVALARKLLVALWRYQEFGEIPRGARFKTPARKAA